jgi:predicted sulfurtransferase
MHDEPIGLRATLQSPKRKRCPACQQAKCRSDFATTPRGASSYCQECQRTASRLASRRRAAAMRLLIAAHPEEWAGLLGLVRAGRQVATGHPGGGGRGA